MSKIIDISKSLKSSLHKSQEQGMSADGTEENEVGVICTKRAKEVVIQNSERDIVSHEERIETIQRTPTIMF